MATQGAPSYASSILANPAAAAAAAAASAAAAAAGAPPPGGSGMSTVATGPDMKHTPGAPPMTMQAMPTQMSSMPPGAAAFAPYSTGMVFTAPEATVIDDQPTYVNPKQYARILKRREIRKKQTGTDVTSYTPRKRSYMHESRHKHAMQRRRGPGGRFLSKQEREDISKQQRQEEQDGGGPHDDRVDDLSKSESSTGKDSKGMPEKN